MHRSLNSGPVDPDAADAQRKADYEQATKTKPKPKKLKATIVFNDQTHREILYTSISKDFTTGFLLFHGVTEKVLFNPALIQTIDVEEVPLQ